MSFLHGFASSHDLFVEIGLHRRGKDCRGKVLEPDLDDVVEQFLDRERRQQLSLYDSGTVLNVRNDNDNRSGEICKHCKRRRSSSCCHKHLEFASFRGIRYISG